MLSKPNQSAREVIAELQTADRVMKLPTPTEPLRFQGIVMDQVAGVFVTEKDKHNDRRRMDIPEGEMTIVGNGHWFDHIEDRGGAEVARTIHLSDLGFGGADWFRRQQKKYSATTCQSYPLGIAEHEQAVMDTIGQLGVIDPKIIARIRRMLNVRGGFSQKFEPEIEFANSDYSGWSVDERAKAIHLQGDKDGRGYFTRGFAINSNGNAERIQSGIPTESGSVTRIWEDSRDNIKTWLQRFCAEVKAPGEMERMAMQIFE
jgi:hypothetical protein